MSEKFNVGFIMHKIVLCLISMKFMIYLRQVWKENIFMHNIVILFSFVFLYIKRVLLKRRRSHGRVTYVLCIHKHIKLTWWRKRKINIRKSTLYAYMSFMISIITCWLLWKRLLFITAQDWIQWQGIYFSLEICEIMLCIKAFKEEFKSRFMTRWLFQIINHIILL